MNPPQLSRPLLPLCCQLLWNSFIPADALLPRIVDIRPFKDAEGIGRCDLVLEPKLFLTQWQPRRAFQGWRYLTEEDAPADANHSTGDGNELPASLRHELANLGLL